MVHNFFKQKNIMKFISSAMILSSAMAFSSSETDGDIVDCDTFGQYVQLANEQDIVARVHPFADIVCGNFTTFKLNGGYELSLVAPNGINIENFFGAVSFENVRLEVTNGSKFVTELVTTFELPAEFDDRGRADFELPDVNGGSLYIGVDSNVVFLNDVKFEDIGVRSQTVEDSDFPDHQNDGGVVNNKGFFRVNGFATFLRSENSGGGEGSPGRGGAIFNDVTGSILFQGGVEFNDISITDDEGNNGGAIYNLGKVNIKANSKFVNLRAESGGAIFNGGGGKITFRDKANVLFDTCRSFDGSAGAIFNRGDVTFAGPALFVNCDSPNEGGAIVVSDSGTMNISKDSYFFNTRSGGGAMFQSAPVVVRTGGSLKFNEENVSFVGSQNFFPDENFEVCESVYFEDGNKCVDN